MTFESLDTLLTTIWHSLDDIFVCVGVFLVARVFASAVSSSLSNYFRSSRYISEIAYFGIVFVSIVFSVLVLEHL